MPTHLVFKSTAFDTYEYFMNTYMEYKRFVVEELGIGDENLHRHVYYDGDFASIEGLRKRLNKHRGTPKVGNVSIKSWDTDLSYFCKGDLPIHPPKVLVNEMGLTEQTILELQMKWRSHPSQMRDTPSDKASVKDLAFDKCRKHQLWPMMSPEQVCHEVINVYVEGGMKRTVGSKQQMQNIIKTILLFMDPETYKVRLAQSTLLYLL